jgi:hypothetical protein
MSGVYTYNPEKVQLVLGGYTVVGWNEISIKRAVPAFKVVKGINGKHTRVKDPDTSAIITIGVIQTSDANDVLSRTLELDIENGTGRIELTLKDGSGDSVFSSIEGFIVGYPDVVYKDQIGFNLWTIVCLSTDSFYVAGNASPSESEITNILERFNLI